MFGEKKGRVSFYDAHNVTEPQMNKHKDLIE